MSIALYRESDWIATMNADIILLLILYGSALSIDENECPSPQFLRVGSEGVISCSFYKNFYSLIWYSSTDVFNSEAVVTMIGSLKSGSGYLSGKYDIYPNGSLILYNVSLEDDGTFTAIILQTPTSDVIRYDVDVFTTAPTLSLLPIIRECGNASEICFKVLPQHTEVLCKVRDAQPAIPLRWMIRTNNGDQNVSSSLSISNGTHPFLTTYVTTTELFMYSSILALLACKADSPSGLLENNESLILIQNGDEALSSVASVVEFVEKGNGLVLNCTHNTDNKLWYFTWQAKKSSETIFSNILFAVFHDGSLKLHIDNYEYSVLNDGSLVIENISIEYEGTYRCISSNGMEDDVIQYDVTVYALPDHAYPEVDGCNGRQHCVLEMAPEGSLTCAVRGIRPLVQLEIRIISDNQLSKAFFVYDQKLSHKRNGDVFNISLTSKYRLNDDSRTRVTIECEVVGTNIEQFKRSTRVDIFFPIDYESATEGNSNQSNEKSTDRHYLWSLPVMLILVLLSFVAYKRKAWKRILPENCSIKTEEDIPMMELDHTEVLKCELEAKYQNLYDAVQPVPFIKGQLYSVNRIFVHGGIEVLVNNSNKKRTWKKLNSYQDILRDHEVKSSRCILEGLPGYGKSTLCLQLAYEWCSKDTSSPLTKTDILLMLSLGEIGEVKSFFAAIKQFLLPKDTSLTEELIQDIVSKSSSVLILLDGFDEYLVQARNIKSDIMSIIAGEMFQQCYVILTTRTSHLPEEYPPHTKRLKLTGFDDMSRDEYIHKVVSYDIESANKVKERLGCHPMLSLQNVRNAPFLFVIFAHLSHESENFQTFQPVTIHFRYIISCVNSHMKKKITARPIQSYDSFEKGCTLNKLAFEGLVLMAHPIYWSKKYVQDLLGKQSYERYVRMGILVEEELLNISDDYSQHFEYIDYNVRVRFLNRLFCEWYAAHYLSEQMMLEDGDFDKMLNLREVNVSEGKASSEVFMNNVKLIHYPNNAKLKGNCLQYIDPCNFQYLYRFTSGLNFKVAKRIIEYLKRSDGTETFITLCKLEQNGKGTEAIQEVKDFCWTNVIIHKSYNLLSQMSIIELLKIAATNKIPILSLNLRECYHSVRVYGKVCINLKSGVLLPLLPTLRRLTIEERGWEYTSHELEDVLQYSLDSTYLEEVWFWECLLPQSCHLEALRLPLPRNFQVKWCPYLTSLSPQIYKLDLEKGLWKCGDKEMTDEEYKQAKMQVGKFKTEGRCNGHL